MYLFQRSWPVPKVASVGQKASSGRSRHGDHQERSLTVAPTCHPAQYQKATEQVFASPEPDLVKAWPRSKRPAAQAQV